ncbi:MAG: carboxypeptidase-like regulatory domain-containing protein, partial [bacterium]
MNAKKKLTTGVGGIGYLKMYLLTALLMVACSKAQLPMEASSIEGQLVITVNQDSALVVVEDHNHRIVAQTQNRYAAYKLPAGEYTVTAKKAGLQPAEQVVMVVAGQETVVTLDLFALQADPPNLVFSVAQDSVEYGEAVDIEWQSNGFQVVIDQGVGIRGPVGSEEVNFVNPGKKTFTATAYAEGNVLTIKHDSTYVKEAPVPLLPVLMLSTTSLVTVETPARITWLSQNADYVVVDFVENAGLQGTKEVRLATAGIRIVTAPA